MSKITNTDKTVILFFLILISGWLLGKVFEDKKRVPIKFYPNTDNIDSVRNLQK